METEIVNLREIITEAHKYIEETTEAYSNLLGEAYEKIEQLESELNHASGQIATLKAKKVQTEMDKTVENLIAESPSLKSFREELSSCSNPFVATKLAEKLLTKLNSGKKVRVEENNGNIAEALEGSDDEKSSHLAETSSDLSESVSMPKEIISEADAGKPTRPTKILSESVNRMVKFSKMATARKQN